ncbi:MAG: hypothetical protein Q8R30_00450 [bacterium]|nr:hypothetical protein [bacterium]
MVPFLFSAPQNDDELVELLKNRDVVRVQSCHHREHLPTTDNPPGRT